ncbi:MAG: hypothetical protein C0397_02345 [Odoribacter sp.]|nr:hypothetical protein [Odoribacter sp.]
MTKNYIVAEEPWKNISNENRLKATQNNQLYICREIGCNYRTMNYAVFDPSKVDLIHLIALFNDILDAKIFVNARQCMEDLCEDS